MRTSMALSLSPARLLPALAPAVDALVHQEAERDVDQHHEGRQAHAFHHRPLEHGDHEDSEERRGDPGPLRRALPRGRTVQALLPAPARDLLGVLARARLTGAAPMLNRAGLRALVLTPTLALGLSHIAARKIPVRASRPHRRGKPAPGPYLTVRSTFSIRCRSGEKPRTGTSSGKSAKAASGARPTSSASAMSASARTASTTALSGVAR